MGGGGKAKTPEIKPPVIPETPRPAPQPEQSADVVATPEKMSPEGRTVASKKRGISSLVIPLVGVGSQTSGAGGLNIPR